MPWYWVIYFQTLNVINIYAGLTDLHDIREDGWLIRFYWHKIARPSYQRLLDMRERGLY